MLFTIRKEVKYKPACLLVFRILSMKYSLSEVVSYFGKNISLQAKLVLLCDVGKRKN